MAYINPTVSAFKTYFVRDFVYGNTTATVMDSDIDKAQTEAFLFVNPNLFDDQLLYTNGMLYLAAHYLVMDLRASSQGLSGTYPWPTTSKAVGGVSESFQIPQRIMDNPDLVFLTKTYYGSRYLQLILSGLSGQVYTVWGRTNA